jgi:hypothetical protein
MGIKKVKKEVHSQILSHSIESMGKALKLFKKDRIESTCMKLLFKIQPLYKRLAKLIWRYEADPQHSEYTRAKEIIDGIRIIERDLFKIQSIDKKQYSLISQSIRCYSGMLRCLEEHIKK